ncbi:unnamed protein product, partial [Prorocentrum cordatum]
AEDTIISLSVSFLIARAVVSPATAAPIGHALSVDAWGPPTSSAGHAAEVLRLLGAALLLGVAAALLGATRRGGRARALCEAVAASASAWTALAGLLAGLRSEAFGAARGPLAAVHLALVCTTVAFAGAVAVRPSEQSTEALGLLSGLAWAGACGKALATAVFRAPGVPGVPAAALEQALGVLVCAMVVPTWRLAALPKQPSADVQSEQSCARAAPPELVGGGYAPPLPGGGPELTERRVPGGQGSGPGVAGEDAMSVLHGPGAREKALAHVVRRPPTEQETEHARRGEATRGVHQRSLTEQLREADAAMSCLRATLNASADEEDRGSAAGVAAARPASPACSMPRSTDGKASDPDRPPLLRTMKRISVAQSAIKKDLREGCEQMRRLQASLEDEEERLVAIEASLSGTAAEALERLGQLRGRLAARPVAAPPSESGLSAASRTESVKSRGGTKVRTYPLPQVPHAGVEVHTFPFEPQRPS